LDQASELCPRRFRFGGKKGDSCAAIAQSVNPVEGPVIRYHFGDEPGQATSGDPLFAAPDFNDSIWAIAPNGSYPLPAFQSDGIVWLRIRLPIPSAVSSPLARGLHHSPNAREIFAGGRSIARQGQLPPHPAATVYSITVVPLPSYSALSRDKSGAPAVMEYAPVTAIPAGFWNGSGGPSYKIMPDASGQLKIPRGPSVLGASRVRSIDWCPFMMSQITMA
jgi:hypothetical protein